jgi:hypothetical protein
MEAHSHFTAKYRCSDYLGSRYAKTGHWDESGQFWLIVPIAEVEEHSDIAFLQVGRPGVDGIGFGYRAGLDGLWAYYPILGEFELKAATVGDLVEGWESGAIAV